MPSIPHSKKKSVMRSRDVSSTRPSSWKGVGAIGMTPLISLVRTKISSSRFKPACYGGSDAGDETAVDADDRPRHVRGALTGQKCYDVGVFFRVAVAPHRNGPRALSGNLFHGAVFAFGLGLIQEQDPLRRDATGQHDVGGDAVAPNLARQRFRPANK